MICKFRHDISVTTYEISTSSKKKTLDGEPYIFNSYNFQKLPLAKDENNSICNFI